MSLRVAGCLMPKLSTAIAFAVLGMAGIAYADDLKLSDGEGLPAGAKLSDGVSLVEKVTKVELVGFVIDPHTQTVLVEGEVQGKGWSDETLAVLDEVQIPEHPDKFIDVAFTAVAPKPLPDSGAAVKVSADHTFDQRQSTAEGVRVWSRTNCIQMTWAAESTVMDLKDCRAAAVGQVP